MIPISILKHKPILILADPIIDPKNIVYKDWDDVLNHFSELFTETNTRFNGTGILFADCVTAKKLQKGLVELMYSVYHKEDDHWLEESKHIRIVANKIPEAILAKFGGADGKVDITDEIETELATRKFDD